MTKSLIEKEIERKESGLDNNYSIEVIRIAVQKAREELKNRIIHDYRIEHKSCGYVIEHIEKVMGE